MLTSKLTLMTFVWVMAFFVSIFFRTVGIVHPQPFYINHFLVWFLVFAPSLLLLIYFQLKRFFFLDSQIWMCFEVILKVTYHYFIFTSNNDVQDLLIFGHNIDTWLIYVLIFFGLTSLAFVFVWLIGFLGERQSGKSTKQPWE